MANKPRADFEVADVSNYMYSGVSSGDLVVKMTAANAGFHIGNSNNLLFSINDSNVRFRGFAFSNKQFIVGSDGSGTSNLPVIAFSNDISTGFYRPSEGIIGVSAGGIGVTTFSSSNLSLKGNLILSGDILPNQTLVRNIGASNSRIKNLWVDTIYLGSNTLYIGDTPVLGTNQNTIQIAADPDQGVTMKTSGTGITTVTSTAGVNVNASGLNAQVQVQSTGTGGRVVMGAASEVSVAAPTFTVSGNSVMNGNMTVNGNVTVAGSNFVANVETVEIKDNILVLNKGQTGSGVSAGKSGIAIDRGDVSRYELVFEEATQSFRMGAVGATEVIATQTWTSNAYSGVITATSNTAYSASAIARDASNVAYSAASSTVVVNTSNAAYWTSNVSVSASNRAFGSLALTGGTLTGNIITQSIIPASNLLYDLGTSNMRFRDLYISGNTIDMGGTKITADTSNNIVITDNQNNLKRIIVDEVQIGLPNTSNSLTLKGNSNGGLQISSTSQSNITLNDASAITSGILSTARGGTGTTSLSANKLLVANSNSSIVTTPSGLHWDSSNNRFGINQINPTQALDVTGNIYCTGDVLFLSDERYKQNIIKIDSALSKIKKINGYTFEMKNEFDKKRHAGVIAQEVLNVLPEVIIDNNGVLSVAYGNMISLLIEAIKELAEKFV